MSTPTSASASHPTLRDGEGVCAAPACLAASAQRCGGCGVVFYCSRAHQQAHYASHRADCHRWRPLRAADADLAAALADPATAAQLHQREFRRVVHRHGLDKGSKADELAIFLTDAANVTEVSAEDVAQRFGIPRDDAATLLAWINIGVRFKEENLDKAPANKKEADIKPAAADAAAR